MRKKTLPPEIAGALIAIHNSGNVLLNVINNNFDLSGIEAGKIEAEPDGEKAALLTMYPQLAGAFIQDAARARDVLTAILAKCGAYGDDDIRMYTVNVHAMKSVLANMGEKELSAVAARLEQAGRAKDTAVIENETPAFLEKLREIIEKITPRQNDDDAEEGADPQPGSEDYAYLGEKLLVITKACDDYDRKTAKDTIAELRQKKWSKKTVELLGTMARHLLNGDFDEVSNTAEKIQT